MSEHRNGLRRIRRPSIGPTTRTFWVRRTYLRRTTEEFELSLPPETDPYEWLRDDPDSFDEHVRDFGHLAREVTSEVEDDHLDVRIVDGPRGV